ncbi:MAG: UDP-N-acetylglucosamine 2-epimerase (non-hydrolyzing) [Deltaproteobacteria bacterium]|nr:UDP-N-acetylglucosamine 2-epimerase (non-hydrolyzing) [Deltaproteobacteria bacterium]
MSTPSKIVFVVGARPNFPKVAPILAALRGREDITPLLVHTGQHYDPELSAMFFEDLGIAPPDVMLGVGSGSHAVQTAHVMMAFETVCLEEQPDAVVVLGDVNSTVACALVASKLHIPVAHVEAGLRSGDRTMPEELNRLVTDQLSERLYTHCREADDNLASEGVPASRVRFVGNVMIDTLLRLRPQSTKPELAGFDLTEHSYGLVTLHRPALVDEPASLRAMIAALSEISSDLPLLYPTHPRSMARLVAAGLVPEGTDARTLPQVAGSRLHLSPPVRYLQFLWLMDHARLVLTDSGGIQEETAVLGVPCLTIRDNTERAVTIEQGTNTLVGTDPADVLVAAAAALSAEARPNRPVPELWDGGAGERIAADLESWLRP